MQTKNLGIGVILTFTLQLFTPLGHASSAFVSEEIRLWQGDAPGLDTTIGEERRSVSKGPVGDIEVINNVTVPTITVYRPEAGKANGTGVLVLPGGAFVGLAWDVEGTEVANWFVEQGVTAFLLKYRVHPFPVAPERYVSMTVDELIDVLRPAWRVAVTDANEAVRWVRANSDRFDLDKSKIGAIGFSAGAATTLGVLLSGDPSAELNFAAPIYGMLMTDSSSLPDSAPPIFLAAAQDDKTLPVQKTIDIFQLWNNAGKPAELHVYQKGGHGFGSREQKLPVDHWTSALRRWLSSRGML